MDCDVYDVRNIEDAIPPAKRVNMARVYLAVTAGTVVGGETGIAVPELKGRAPEYRRKGRYDRERTRRMLALKGDTLDRALAEHGYCLSLVTVECRMEEVRP